MAARARREESPGGKTSRGETTSSRGCGTLTRTSGEGLPGPHFKWRYHPPPSWPKTSPMDPPVKYPFDDFEGAPKAAELRRNGTRLKLQLKPFQLLVAMLEKPGEVVGREELRLGLWREDTFVDFDHGLKTAMAKLR